ncbi:MBL fold metallo-hydrolase [Rhodocytophaga aerolata]|uniref:MBL fold metallo-hydrolase n=1 Tax=Rhodocytophaga aerolata TaxID=455078 RepID=A0ABT8RF85_9BACT|nr:MBL fold metallo-hydrolase [Rhodocytophaga aerolata]MDO1449382.1 MBL fold metallo-hydrolase [Rhodocytophaga aerolata]
MKITWLGQSGFLIESAGHRLLIDPFMSDIVEQKQGLKRLRAFPLSIAELRPNTVFITHNHLDHFDPIALLHIHQMYPEARIAGPESVMQKAREMNFNEAVLVSMPKGRLSKLGPFTLRSTPAYHSDPYAVGCVLEAEGKIIYMSGDTLLTDTLVEEVTRLCPQPVDVAFIVINGRLGNMNSTEALHVVSQLKPALSIPMHYGMFAENTADPYVFAKACDEIGLANKVLTLGEAYVV